MAIPLLDAIRIADTSSQTSTMGFLHYLESHLEYIKRDPSIGVLELDKGAVYHSLEDAYTFQRRMRIPRDHWWVNLRLNNMYHQNDMLDGMSIFITIPHALYNSLYSSYVSTQRRI